MHTTRMSLRVNTGRSDHGSASIECAFELGAILHSFHFDQHCRYWARAGASGGLGSQPCFVAVRSAWDTDVW